MSYADEVKEKLSGIFLVLLDLLNSKKFWASTVAGVSAWYETGDIRYLYGALLAFAVAQAAADFGKDAAAINLVAQAQPQPVTVVKPPVPPKPPGRPVKSVFVGAVAETLIKAGLTTIEAVSEAGDDTLAAAGFSPVQVKRIRQDLADHP